MRLDDFRCCRKAGIICGTLRRWCGADVEREGVHYPTPTGMLDAEETAYATIEFSDHAIIVRGVGRQEDITLTVRQSPLARRPGGFI